MATRIWRSQRSTASARYRRAHSSGIIAVSARSGAQCSRSTNGIPKCSASASARSALDSTPISTSVSPMRRPVDRCSSSARARCVCIDLAALDQRFADGRERSDCPRLPVQDGALSAAAGFVLVRRLRRGRRDVAQCREHVGYLPQTRLRCSAGASNPGRSSVVMTWYRSNRRAKSGVDLGRARSRTVQIRRECARFGHAASARRDL